MSAQLSFNAVEDERNIVARCGAKWGWHMAHLVEQLRQYAVANGGHATHATNAGVTQAEWVAVMQGRRRAGSAIAAYAASTIGCTASQFRAADADRQLLTNKGALP